MLAGQSTAARSGAVVVRLRAHVFGHTRAADAQVVGAGWGSGPGQVGFHHEDCCETGGSSFDVVDGVVYLLDQNNSRVLKFAPGRQPRSLPLRGVGQSLAGETPALAVGTDGMIYVLVGESIGDSHTLWSFPAHGGRPLATALTYGEQLRTDGSAVLVSAPEPGVGKKPVDIPDHWRQLMDRGRVAKGKWLPYRPIPGGTRLDVRSDAPHRVVRATVTAPDGSSTSWRITARDDFTVDDTDVVGADLVLVLGFYNEKVREEEVIVLGRKGIVRSFATPDDYYVDAAYFANFRVEGRSLYRLGSTREGVYVDRYRL